MTGYEARLKLAIYLLLVLIAILTGAMIAILVTKGDDTTTSGTPLPPSIRLPNTTRGMRISFNPSRG